MAKEKAKAGDPRNTDRPGEEQASSGDGRDKAAQDNHADQLNPEHSSYRAAQDNRANQLNPEHPSYGSSRRR